MSIDKWLVELVIQKGSDLFITVGIPPSIKVRGTISRLDEMALSQERVRDLIFGLLDEKQISEFIQKKELNIAIQNETYGPMALR